MTTLVWGGQERSSTISVLRDAIEQYDDRQLLDIGGTSYGYGEVAQMVNRLAHGLADVGVTAGDRVATMLDNSVDAVTTWFAVNTLGAVLVPLNTALKGAFLNHQLVDSGAKLIVVEGHYIERLAKCVEGASSVSTVLCRGSVPEIAVAGAETRGLASAYASDASALGIEVTPEQPCALWYTAGTTGPSKGCVISHNMACTVASHSLRTMGRRLDELQWTPLPMFHINAPLATVLASVMIGGAASIVERFSLSGFWPEIERSGARVVSLLGSMVNQIAQMPTTPEMERCRGQIRVAWATPFPPDTVKVWNERFGVQVAGAGSFGQTETGSITIARLEDDRPAGSSGKADWVFDVMVVDENDEPVPTNQVGEIVSRPRAPHVMFDGYWGRAESTLDSCGNLWFHSGDLGRMDEDGWLYFVDRKKDYLRRRGENISSYEMEAAFREHPDVEEVAVYAVPSDLTEDDVKIAVVRTVGAALTEEELCRWSIERVPYFAVPRYIEFLEHLPMSHVGRVYKYQLRESHDPSKCWDRESADIEVAR